MVIAKALRARERERAAPPDPGSGWLGRLAAEQRLAVKQQVERLEAFTGIETTNAYAILDGAGNVLLHAEEEAGSVADFLVRNYLEALRPFTLRVATPHGETAFVVRRLLGALLLIDFAHFDDR